MVDAETQEAPTPGSKAYTHRGRSARCWRPLSLPVACGTLGGGGAQGQSLSCPLSRKRPSSVNKQPSPHLQVKARKNLQRAHTCWAKRVLVWGEMGRPRGGGHYALRGRWGALRLDAGPLGYPPGWRGTAWLS